MVVSQFITFISKLLCSMSTSFVVSLLSETIKAAILFICASILIKQVIVYLSVYLFGYGQPNRKA